MKIETEIIVKVTKADGTAVVFGRTYAETTGDNPSYERREIDRSVRQATEVFLDRHNVHQETKQPT